MEKAFKFTCETLTEAVLSHRLQGVGLRDRHIHHDRTHRGGRHLALKTSVFRELHLLS